MEISNKTQWVIMSKDKTLIAKGTPRNRKLVRVDDIKCKKRYLTYSSEKMAISAFTNCGFYGLNQLDGFKHNSKLSDFFDAVKVNITINIY